MTCVIYASQSGALVEIAKGYVIREMPESSTIEITWSIGTAVQIDDTVELVSSDWKVD